MINSDALTAMPRSSRYRSNRRGQGYAEYGLILVLVALLVFVTLMNMGYDISDFYDETAYNVQLVSDGRAGEALGSSGYSYTPPSHGDPEAGP